MNKILLVSIIFVITSLIFPAVLSVAIRQIPNAPQPSLEDTERIYGVSVVVSPFESVRNNLSAIGTSVKNPNLKNKNDLTLWLFSEEGELVRQSTINGRAVADGDFTKFKFTPIPDSATKKYSFVLTSFVSSNEEAFQVFYSNQPQEFKSTIIPCVEDLKMQVYNISHYPKEDCLGLSVKNEDKNSISFVSFYTPRNFLSTALEIYQNWVNKFTADKPFFFAYLFILILLSGILIFSLLKKKQN